MKYKTSKLAKLERNRKSILTDDLKHCYICKKPATDLHEIYGGANRKASMLNDFCIPMCRSCHQIVTLDYMMSLTLKKVCQEKFEETHERAEFIRIIGKNFLE